MQPLLGIEQTQTSLCSLTYCRSRSFILMANVVHLYRVVFVQVLSAVLSAGEELEAQEMLESLVQLADVSPLFFRTSVVSQYER